MFPVVQLVNNVVSCCQYVWHEVWSLTKVSTISLMTLSTGSLSYLAYCIAFRKISYLIWTKSLWIPHTWILNILILQTDNLAIGVCQELSDLSGPFHLWLHFVFPNNFSCTNTCKKWGSLNTLPTFLFDSTVLPLPLATFCYLLYRHFYGEI